MSGGRGTREHGDSSTQDTNYTNNEQLIWISLQLSNSDVYAILGAAESGLTQYYINLSVYYTLSASLVNTRFTSTTPANRPTSCPRRGCDYHFGFISVMKLLLPFAKVKAGIQKTSGPLYASALSRSARSGLFQSSIRLD